MGTKDKRSKSALPGNGWVRQAAIELTVLGRRYLVAMRTNEEALASTGDEKRRQTQTS